MTIEKVTRVVYGLLGVFYVVVGIGSMLLPAGWLPAGVMAGVAGEAQRSAFTAHLLQEFGTVVLGLGFVFLWYAGREVHSRAFHWAMTFYLALDALIHWVGPEGSIGSWQRGIANSIPFAVMLTLGLLELRVPARRQMSGNA